MFLDANELDTQAFENDLRSTLILPVSALNFFMDALLYLSLQYACTCWLIVAGGFQYVRCVDVVVGPTAHDLVAIDRVLVDRDLRSIED